MRPEPDPLGRRRRRSWWSTPTLSARSRQNECFFKRQNASTPELRSRALTQQLRAANGSSRLMSKHYLSTKAGQLQGYDFQRRASLTVTCSSAMSHMPYRSAWPISAARCCTEYCGGNRDGRERLPIEAPTKVVVDGARRENASEAQQESRWKGLHELQTIQVGYDRCESPPFLPPAQWAPR